jgi:hypothetical protein
MTKLTESEKIKEKIQNSLLTSDSLESYLNILNQRIDDNRKAMGRLFLVLILVGLAFPLLQEAKISEVSIGPFKISDIQIAIAIIPTVFAFTFYKYMLTWFNIVEQKKIFKNLTSIVFNIDTDSSLNKNLRSFSITDSLDNYIGKKLDTFGCLASLLWIPTGLVLFLFPFIYEVYLIKSIRNIFGLDSFLSWVIFITPLLIGIFTVVHIIQIIRSAMKD